jgi:hypothetical protein
VSSDILNKERRIILSEVFTCFRPLCVRYQNFQLLAPEKKMSFTQSEDTVCTLPTSSDEDIFLAGSTMLSGIPLFEGITDDMIIPHSWSSCDHESFQLRVGPNYKRNKAKASSPYPFYEPAGFDFLKCRRRIDNIGSKVKIPEEWLDMPPNLMNLPPVFIVNTQVNTMEF